MHTVGSLPTDEELALVSSLAEKQIRLEKEFKRLQEQTDLKKKELLIVSDRELPAAIAETGLAGFTLTNGRKVSIKTEVFAAITEERAAKAFAWLRENKFGSLIKNVISVEFGKGEDEKALEAATILAEAGFQPQQKEGVHPMTLKAFLREQLSKGNDVPLELFGAFIIDRAKVE